MTDWGVVLATFLGPIAAVAVTFWRESRREKRERKLWVFRTLMASRATAMHIDHVRALNLVLVEFAGQENVLSAWRTYIKHLDTPIGPTSQENQKWGELRRDLLLDLLSAMAKVLGYPLTAIDTKHGGYAPQGWMTTEDRVSRAYQFAIDLSEGRKAIPVFVHTTQNEPLQESKPVQAQ